MGASRPNFSNPDVHTQTWYVGARSSDVRIGQVKSYPLLHRNIILYRDASGAAHAMDGRCPHLGADLGQGEVVEDMIQCPFHHWRFGPDGRCRSAPGHHTAPGRGTRAYPVEERWGLIWFFNGPQPLFPLPSLPDADRYRILLPPARRIGCHPHLVVGNGLDSAHLEALHGMKFTAPPVWSSQPPFQVSSFVQGCPRSRWIQFLTGSARCNIKASFSAVGGNLAWATISQPVRFHVLFTGQPAASGGCRTQLVLFLPSSLDLRPLRALALLAFLLRNDHRILERLEFKPAYADGDECLAALAEIVNRMPTW